MAKRLASADRNGQVKEVAAPELRKGDLVLVEAGDVIPGDGDVVEGVASVDESAITGESAPVIRESGGDRSAVTGGTRVLSDWIVVQISANPGETFWIACRTGGGARRQKTPNEIALNILIASLTASFRIVVVSLGPFAIYSGQPVSVTTHIALLVCSPTRHWRLLSAIGIAGMDRWCSTMCWPSGRAGGSSRRCRCTAARQGWHDYAGRSPGKTLCAHHRGGGREVAHAAISDLSDETEAVPSWTWPRSGMASLMRLIHRQPSFRSPP
jgi:K+-transporting ATPase ATPase B chain